MHARLSIAFLLTVAMTTMAVSRPLIVSDDPPVGRQEAGLTPEEKQEARDVAARFSKQWQMTSDFGQIIDEMFVQGFPERLRQAPKGWIPWEFLDRSLIAYASRDELRRYYVASMNFYGLCFRLYEVAERLKKRSGNDEGELKFEEVLSPEVVNLLLSNPTFAELVELDKKDESNERTKEDDHNQLAESGDSAQAAETTAEDGNDGSTEKSETGIIKTLAQLNDASATLEKTNELLRKRLANMSSTAQATSSGDDTEGKWDSTEPYLTSLDEGEFGYPKSTPVIHLDLLPFCIHLIKIDGQLKILSVAIYVD